MASLFDPPALPGLWGDAEDYDTRMIVDRMRRNQAYENSLFGRIADWLGRQQELLEGASAFNPIAMALEGAQIANRWAGSPAFPERVQYGDMLAPLGLGAMAAPFAVRGAIGSAGGKLKGARLRSGASAAEPQGIRAYHGSPYDFDRFDMSKIGTGEGAQAYGHGLYFAEAEDVAKQYRDALAMKAAVDPNAPLTDPKRIAAELYETWQGDVKGALDDARYYDNAAEVIAELRKLEANPPKGRMYEVNIRANPDEFLDWDKPLSEQSEFVQRTLGVTPEVKQALADHLNSMRPKSAYDPDLWAKMRLLDDNPRGSTIAGNDPDSARRLREAGIPGIRYLDQGSRAAGEGTRNYVLFRDDIIDIIRKYGIAAAISTYGFEAVQGVLADMDQRQEMAEGDQ